MGLRHSVGAGSSTGILAANRVNGMGRPTLAVVAAIVLAVAVAAISCAGDPGLGGADVLDYGQSAQRGQFTCASSQAGVTCKDAANGHGFDLSRQAYKLY